MRNVLFVCVQNAGRSLIAESLFARESGGSRRARSAGSDPGGAPHAEVVEVMAELDIDLSDRVPTRLERSDVEWADLVVTMGCGDACPVIPGKEYIDWDLPDPAGRPLEEVRRIRDEIGDRVRGLLKAEARA